MILMPRENEFRDEFKELFLNNAKNKHGDKYDYSKVNYFNYSTPIIVRCKKHNLEYETTPNLHLINKYDCPKCLKESKTLTQKEFLKRAKQVHGDKYNYDKTIYEHNNKPVIITCPKHGDFLQRPHNHTQGQNCLKCVMEKRRLYKQSPIGLEQAKLKSLNNFLNKAKQKYGNKYIFPNIKEEYKGLEFPITIICPEHGEFKVIPHNFLRPNRHGCKKCSVNTHGLEKFLQKAKKKHGDKYDYSKVDLSNTYINIRCKKHNVVFQQDKRNHLRYDGCPMCIKEKINTTPEEFLKRAKKITKDKYEYDLTNFKNMKSKIRIKCKLHGWWEEEAQEHVRTSRTIGCPICNGPESERLIFEYLKSKDLDVKTQIKINGYRWRYDFYIPKYNLLIECDDVKHFVQINKNIDYLKDILAIKNGYNIERIEWTEKTKSIFKKLIDSILDKYKNKKVDNKSPII